MLNACELHYVYNEHQSSKELGVRYQERDSSSLYLWMSCQFFRRQTTSEILVLVYFKVASWTVLHDPPESLRNFMTVCNGEILTYTITLADLSSFDVQTFRFLISSKKGDNTTKVNWIWYWSAYVIQNTVHFSDFDRVQIISCTRQRKIFRLHYFLLSTGHKASRGKVNEFLHPSLPS